MIEDRTKNIIEIVRAVTRALAFLIPLTTLCIALFLIEAVQDTIVGGVMGAASVAGIFYFKKDET